MMEHPAANPDPSRLLDPVIFDTLQANLEEEQRIHDDLGNIVQRLSRAVAYAQGVLSRVHATPLAQYEKFLPQASEAIDIEIPIVKELADLASKQPYYKYNHRWNRTMQSAVGTVLLRGLLESFHATGQLKLLSLDEVGGIFKVPVNLKDRDAFHITIEEYLLALTDLTGELSRLATNTVTLGDLGLAVRIAAFVRDVFAGFQVLNLKNDVLRRRVDGVKYDVKRVEEMVYDLSLRNMIPKEDGGDAGVKTVGAE